MTPLLCLATAPVPSEDNCHCCRKEEEDLVTRMIQGSKVLELNCLSFKFPHGLCVFFCMAIQSVQLLTLLSLNVLLFQLDAVNSEGQTVSTCL